MATAFQFGFGVFRLAQLIATNTVVTTAADLISEKTDALARADFGDHGCLHLCFVAPFKLLLRLESRRFEC